ncbi:hypothetical protein AVEN_62565-1 [Araneus ventricosus]|uniref:Uncharacterized protein n=1 Tax=Araneus ventricosus TaxID=182803 RepID=A0A4Y2WZK1_ARAVE|nr:hypothetical protein AVEN_62565-1 [Araneus ventricosus]
MDGEEPRIQAGLQDKTGRGPLYSQDSKNQNRGSASMQVVQGGTRSETGIMDNGAAFTPWVALPGEYTPDVHRPLLPVPPPTGLTGPCVVQTFLLGPR